MFGWQPGIGDPTFWGWFTVAAYFSAALLGFRAYRLSAPAEPLTRKGVLVSHVQRRFWLGTVVVLTVLGINKQLDLQGLVTGIGRALAESQGWYESRRVVQQIFIAGIVGAGAIVIAAALWAFRRGGAWVQLAQVGLIALCSFVVVRAASFHHVDMMLGTPVGFLKLNHVLELGGIAVIALAAAGAGFRR